MQYHYEGLLVWYHGPVPVDYMGLVARLLRDTGRRVVSVVDRCLDLLPGLDMVREHMRWRHAFKYTSCMSHCRVGSYSKVHLAALLDQGELVGVAPGGGRECLLDTECSVLWHNRWQLYTLTLIQT